MKVAEIYKNISADGGLDLIDRVWEEEAPIVDEADKPF